MTDPIVWLTYKQVCERLGCGKSWLYDQDDPLLQPVKTALGNRWVAANITAYQMRFMCVEVPDGQV